MVREAHQHSTPTGRILKRKDGGKVEVPNDQSILTATLRYCSNGPIYLEFRFSRPTSRWSLSMVSLIRTTAATVHRLGQNRVRLWRNIGNIQEVHNHKDGCEERWWSFPLCGCSTSRGKAMSRNQKQKRHTPSWLELTPPPLSSFFPPCSGPLVLVPSSNRSPPKERTQTSRRIPWS